MQQKPNPRLFVDDLNKALQDETVFKAISSIFDRRFDRIMVKMDDLKQDNAQLYQDNTRLRQDVILANNKIDELEAYNHTSNLITSVFSLTTFADAASTVLARW